jgi:hypothetical protein
MLQTVMPDPMSTAVIIRVIVCRIVASITETISDKLSETLAETATLTYMQDRIGLVWHRILPM